MFGWINELLTGCTDQCLENHFVNTNFFLRSFQIVLLCINYRIIQVNLNQLLICYFFPIFQITLYEICLYSIVTPHQQYVSIRNSMIHSFH